MLKETLKEIVLTQRQQLSRDRTVLREKLKELDTHSPLAAVISGIRRCGKSTLLLQIMVKFKKCYYFNFEDTRVQFQLADFSSLDEVFTELYGSGGVYFFDEIQNVPGWEQFVRRLVDLERKCFITGSDASLLSRELGTRLTGRHLTYELFPFSFREFLKFYSSEPSEKLLAEYAAKGGFPGFLKYGQVELLQELLLDVLARDIVVRYGLRESKTLKDLVAFLISNVGKEFSYNKLTFYFNLGSVNTTIAYISYLEDSYLLFTVPRIDFSLKKQSISPRKIYVIDSGLAAANSLAFTKDKGRILENLVFNHLRRSYSEVFYFKEENECDFVVRQRGKVILGVQVCYNLTEENKAREIAGLLEARKKFNFKDGVIVTWNQKDNLENLKVVSAWEWLSKAV